MRGRKPTPNRIKQLRGNPGRRKLSPEPKYESGMPSCPRELSKEAKKEWRRVAKALLAAGLLAKTDRAALAGYCQGWAEFLFATEIIDKAGRTYTTPEGQLKPHPAVAMQRSAMQQMARFAALFGFSPADRTRVHPLASGDGRDDFSDFLKGAASPN